MSAQGAAAIVDHRAIVKILHVVHLLRVVFLVRRGPLGNSRGVPLRTPEISYVSACLYIFDIRPVPENAL